MKRKIFFSMMVIVMVFTLFIITKNNKINLSLNKKNYKEGINQKATDYLISRSNGLDITNYEDGNKEEMYTFSHSATEQTDALTDYRYIGYNPNNYVYFNCTDDNNTDTCEIWRIIGVFTVEDENGNLEQRLKIIRNRTIGAHAWDENGSNDWNTATLNQYLNNEYFNSLSNTSKSMISSTKYYLGGINSDSYYTYEINSEYNSADTIYNSERGTSVYPNRNINWTGKIGLMYLSDYSFTYGLGVNDYCYRSIRSCATIDMDKGWIGTSIVFYNWTITPSTKVENNVAKIYPNRVWLTTVNESIYISPSGDKNTSAVRPAIYLNNNVYIQAGDGSKNSPYILSTNNQGNTSSQNVGKYKEYQIGDVITYNGEDYYVIKNSNSKTSYVTLLKATLLTVDELYKYGRDENDEFFVNQYTVNLLNEKDLIYEYQDGSGAISYYSRNNCSYSYNPTNIVTDKCISDYNQSDIKKVVDNWANDNLIDDDLVSIDGYKTRLITKEELYDYLEYDHGQMATNEILIPNSDVPSWVYNSNYSYWTMSVYEDSTSEIFNVFTNGYINHTKIPEFSGVRPVINLDKCAIKDGCYEEYTDVEENYIKDDVDSNHNTKVANDNDSIIVTVANTLKTVSNIVLIISILLIIGGVGILGYNYKKSKEQK